MSLKETTREWWAVELQMQNGCIVRIHMMNSPVGDIIEILTRGETKILIALLRQNCCIVASTGTFFEGAVGGALPLTDFHN